MGSLYGVKGGKVKESGGIRGQVAVNHSNRTAVSFGVVSALVFRSAANGG
jgi:hypothetical protein